MERDRSQSSRLAQGVPPDSSSEAASALELIGLGVRFGGISALEDVTLRVLEGEIFGSVGREGAGKSVLLRAAAGRIEPSVGAISVLGVPSGSSESAPCRIASGRRVS
jgi:branched-chain amino acid transport system ATP-binding protein